MSNRRGEASFGDDSLAWNVITIVLTLAFLVSMFVFVSSYRNSLVVWEGFYAKELSKVINSVEPGSEIVFDVTKAVELAERSGKGSENVFRFDNERKEIIVSLRPQGGSSYQYFNDVNVSFVGKGLELASGGATTNRLRFFVE